MFGFMSPSADKFCRLCLISRKDIFNHPTAESVEMRNRKDHNAEVKTLKNLENNPTLELVMTAFLMEAKVFT
jgi:hypothetical protein